MPTGVITQQDLINEVSRLVNGDDTAFAVRESFIASLAALVCRQRGVSLISVEAEEGETTLITVEHDDDSVIRTLFQSPEQCRYYVSWGMEVTAVSPSAAVVVANTAIKSGVTEDEPSLTFNVRGDDMRLYVVKA